MPDSLEQLLKEADRFSDGPRSMQAGLADRVRREAKKRRARNLAACTAVVMLGGLMGWRMLSIATPRQLAHNSARSALPAADVSRIQREIGELTREADSAGRVAERLGAMESRWNVHDADRRKPARQDVLERLRREQDRAAMLAVYEANRISGSLGKRERAVAEYERVVELFPTSCWAEVVRQKLAELKG